MPKERKFIHIDRLDLSTSTAFGSIRAW